MYTVSSPAYSPLVTRCALACGLCLCLRRSHSSTYVGVGVPPVVFACVRLCVLCRTCLFVCALNKAESSLEENSSKKYFYNLKDTPGEMCGAIQIVGLEQSLVTAHNSYESKANKDT